MSAPEGLPRGGLRPPSQPRVITDGTWLMREFTGRRVGVVGPGGEVAPVVDHALASAGSVVAFCDHPDWLVPFGGDRVPGPLGRRLAARRLRRRVDDPWVRRLLTPHQRFGARRPVVAPAFYTALGERCRLVAWPVYAIMDRGEDHPLGVRTAEGIEHRVDVLVITAGAAVRTVTDATSSAPTRRPSRSTRSARPRAAVKETIP
ncbi:hypothetical protein [Nocardioides sp.]|uniref:hypothetical protein n=1 Tax=Nocardioides sp. TaxID=35761 RepID=UPI003514F572